MTFSPTYQCRKQGVILMKKNEKNKKKLKPCKYCGFAKKPRLMFAELPFDKPLVGIVCPNCRSGTEFLQTKKEAINSWNKRQ